MSSATHNPNAKPSPWDAAARGTAIVSGLFCLAVAVLMTANYLQWHAGLPEKEVIYSQRIVDAKAELADDPSNEALKEEIRRLDYEMRRDYFGRAAFADRGKYLLLGGAVVFLLSMKHLYKGYKLPRSGRRVSLRDPNREHVRLAQARRAVGVFGLSALGCALAFALAPASLIPSGEESAGEAGIAAAPPEPAYPSMEEVRQNWPGFRGPLGQGICFAGNVPVSWDGETGEGVLWKTEIPLPGNNSPIAWGDRVFLSGADEERKEVYCFDGTTGEILWRGRVDPVPGNPGGELNVFFDTGHAASTMACDNRRVYVIFVDGDLACFDFEGNRVWAKNLGVPDSVYNFATSLIVYQDTLIIQFDQGALGDDISVLYGLDTKTGAVKWQTPRPVANAWTSPILAETEGGMQIITVSEPWIIGYEADTGTELWRADRMGTDLAPSPSFAKGLAFAIQPNEVIYAYRVDGRGDVSDSHEAWYVDWMAPEIASPVTDGTSLYIVDGTGMLSAFDVPTGELSWEHDLMEHFLASPVLVGEWLYLLSEDGYMHRIKPPEPSEEGGDAPAESVDESYGETTAPQGMDEPGPDAGLVPEAGETSLLEDGRFSATPAFMEGRIYIRGETSLFAVGSE